MKKISLSFIFVCILMLSGCLTGREEFSRYPSVSIPQFGETDYLNLLSDNKPEIVYNSIVNLGAQAERMGEKLSDEKIDKNSKEYITVLNMYKKIIELLNSRDSHVAVASLRFLQMFSNKYKAKAEIAKPVLQIKSGNPQVVYEQIMLLCTVADKGLNIPDAILRQFLNNPSWVVSRSVYLLVNSLAHDRLRRELIKRYRVVKDEKEKLLILTAIKNQFNDYAADFLFTEVLTTKSNKIRDEIFNMLDGGKNQEKVLAWVDNNYDKILSAGGKYLFFSHVSTMHEKFSSRLLSIFITRNFAVDKEFLEKLNKNIEEYKDKKELCPGDSESLDNLLIIEEALLTNNILAQQWKSLREKAEIIDSGLTQLQNEYDAVEKKYAIKIDSVFRKYNISSEKRQEFMKSILEPDSRVILKEMISDEKDQ